MTSGQIINLIIIILGIAGSIYGLYSILYRNLRIRIEKDILLEVDRKFGSLNADNR